MANTVLSQPKFGQLVAVDDRIKRGRILQTVGRFSGGVVIPFASYFFLWAPILVLVLFSFNASRTVDVWRGFTFDWYLNVFNSMGAGSARSSATLMESLRNSLFIGAISTIIATVLGTMLALSMARSKFPGKKIVDGILLVPMVIPEITQGISLALFFKIVFDYVQNTTGERWLPGFGTIIIGHVAFNISYVAIVVRASLQGLSKSYEEASYDLGANYWHTFWRVTFPLILPGIIGGALLAFTLSLDDYLITFYNKGVGSGTLPIYVYGMLKTSVSPEVNALSTIMLAVSTVLVGTSLWLQGRNGARAD
ncbi:MAG: spermidine/putrescine ABC transporter permease PotC [Phototrophicales bacterium]|jgi:spermidine/putrescine transport system permease protein|nr:MAG: spermidine/putrescine ABC transporter permease PotC [Phototrophicales bacterium]